MEKKYHILSDPDTETAFDKYKHFEVSLKALITSRFDESPQKFYRHIFKELSREVFNFFCTKLGTAYVLHFLGSVYFIFILPLPEECFGISQLSLNPYIVGFNCYFLIREICEKSKQICQK
jgi:hypothetical protein